MQKVFRHVLFLSTCFVFFFSSCRKNPTTPTPATQKPAVRPVGQPIGNAVSFQVTSSGGQFTSADHSIEITVPAGAVSSATTFNLQEVENTCLGSVGKSFSITPHVAEFAKPVTIKFSYEASADAVSLPEALNVAYQDAEGIWRAVPNVLLDKNAKSVTITTTHFSNWALFESLKLIPVKTTIGTEEEVSLQLLSFLPSGLEAMLAPLTPQNGKEVGISEGHLLDTKYIKKWSLGGVGNLTSNGATAKYTSPSNVAQPTTVAVSVDLNLSSQQMMVVSNITIIGGGMAYRINGGEWHFVAAYAYKSGGADSYSIAAADPGDNYGLTITWQGGMGSYSWTTNNTDRVTQLTLTNTSSIEGYISVYQKPDGTTEPSGGSLKIDELGATKDSFISGSFRATKAGHLNNFGLQDGYGTVEGYFHAVRFN